MEGAEDHCCVKMEISGYWGFPNTDTLPRWLLVCVAFLETLTLFQTNVCDFGCSILDFNPLAGLFPNCKPENTFLYIK